MDFILTMHAADHPREFKFERRRDMKARVQRMNESTGRANVLIGPAKAAFKKRVSFAIPQKYSGQGVVKRSNPPPPRRPPTRKPPDRG